MNAAIEMLRLTPNQGRANCGFDRKFAVVGEAPFHNGPKHAVDGVVGWLPFVGEIVLVAPMAFQGDHGHGSEFALLESFF